MFAAKGLHRKGGAPLFEFMSSQPLGFEPHDLRRFVALLK
jgi:hypothetical protein